MLVTFSPSDGGHVPLAILSGSFDACATAFVFMLERTRRRSSRIIFFSPLIYIVGRRPFTLHEAIATHESRGGKAPPTAVCECGYIGPRCPRQIYHSESAHGSRNRQVLPREAS